MLNVIINNNIFNVKCLLNEKDVSNGMMGKKFDQGYDGMLFLMDRDDHSFWMVNCITPLDIIFIDGNIITKIHKNCKPCFNKSESDCDRFKGYGDMVLEIKGGDCDRYGISDGMKVNFNN